jgi:hypothetical protein
MKTIEKFKKLIAQKESEFKGKYTKFSRFTILLQEMKETFGEDILDKILTTDHVNKYELYIIDDVDAVYEVRFESVDLDEFFFYTRELNQAVFYVELTDKHVYFIHKSRERKIKEAELMKKVLDHPKFRLSSLFLK